MSEPFDASRILIEPVSAEIIAAHQKTVEGLQSRASALANAKLHAERELGRLVSVCNRIAWGSVPTDLRAPTPTEIAALLERFSAEDRERLMSEARQAAEQRELVERIADAEARCLAQIEAEQMRRAEEEALNEEWAEFEAFDNAEKMKRFDAWRASRR
jgi:hypothetical protein